MQTAIQNQITARQNVVEQVVVNLSEEKSTLKNKYFKTPRYKDASGKWVNREFIHYKPGIYELKNKKIKGVITCTPDWWSKYITAKKAIKEGNFALYNQLPKAECHFSGYVSIEEDTYIIKKGYQLSQMQEQIIELATQMGAKVVYWEIEPPYFAEMPVIGVERDNYLKAKGIDAKFI